MWNILFITNASLIHDMKREDSKLLTDHDCEICGVLSIKAKATKASASGAAPLYATTGEKIENITKFVVMY